MNYKAIPLKLFLSLGAIFVTCLPINAMAAGQCESVFSTNVSYFKESMEPIRALSRMSLVLKDKYLKGSEQLTQKEVVDQLTEMRQLAETYFDKAGISYEIQWTSFGFKNLKDSANYNSKYPVYKIKGSKHGDEVSRMIYGVLSHPLYRKKAVTFQFDLLYGIKAESVGHYDTGTNIIHIGPYSLAAEISGLTNTVRHEVQHYFEHMKILEKKQTTARISFSEAHPKSKDPYHDYFRLDEIETHLRDLRTMLSFDSRAAKDKLFAGHVTPEVWNNILANRKVVISDKFETLDMMLTNSDKILGHLQEKTYPNAFFENHANGEWMGAYLLDGYSYSVVRIDFYGLLPKPQYEMTKPEISKIVKETLDWNHKRVREIRVEFEKLKLKANSR